MNKVTIYGLLALLILHHPVFSQQQIDGRELLKELKKVNGRIMETRIELGEALIKHLEEQGDYVQSERMKNIYRLATEYQNVCDCEQRVLLMYTHTKETVKVYLSAHSRDIIKKKKKDLDESFKNLQRHASEIKDADILTIVSKLQRRIKQGQDLLTQLIQFYSDENANLKNSNGY